MTPERRGEIYQAIEGWRSSDASYGRPNETLGMLLDTWDELIRLESALIDVVSVLGTRHVCAESCEVAHQATAALRVARAALQDQP